VKLTVDPNRPGRYPDIPVSILTSRSVQNAQGGTEPLLVSAALLSTQPNGEFHTVLGDGLRWTMLEEQFTMRLRVGDTEKGDCGAFVFHCNTAGGVAGGTLVPFGMHHFKDTEVTPPMLYSVSLNAIIKLLQVRWEIDDQSTEPWQLWHHGFRPLDTLGQHSPPQQPAAGQ